MNEEQIHFLCFIKLLESVLTTLVVGFKSGVGNLLALVGRIGLLTS
jgi:hypothetical protein